MRILITGLDNAGKATMYHKFTTDKSINELPIINETTDSTYDKNKINWNGLSFNLLDVVNYERRIELKDLFDKYSKDLDGVIFVIDSRDTERMVEASSELKFLMYEYENTTNYPFLIFLNKQDIKTSLSPKEIENIIFPQLSEQINELEVTKEKQDKSYKIQGCSAIYNIGIDEGLDWLKKAIMLRNSPINK